MGQMTAQPCQMTRKNGGKERLGDRELAQFRQIMLVFKPRFVAGQLLKKKEKVNYNHNLKA